MEHEMLFDTFSAEWLEAFCLLAVIGAILFWMIAAEELDRLQFLVATVDVGYCR